MLSTIDALLRYVRDRLISGGSFWIRWRDTSGPLPDGVDRFIPVASDPTRSMHCFIEGIDEGTLRVTDIVTEVTTSGLRTRASSYPKLRLSRLDLLERGTAAGLVHVPGPPAAGMSELRFDAP